MERALKDDEGLCFELALEDWHVVTPPVWNDRFTQARNWMAVVTPDGKGPGGVERVWCPRGRGRLRYNVVGLLEGDLVEFGADSVTSAGRRIQTRWCGEIVRINEYLLLCRHYGSLQEMFVAVRDRNERTQEASLGSG